MSLFSNLYTASSGLNVASTSMSIIGDKKDEILRLTQEYTSSIENIIRKHPEQWGWMHNRWKTRPEDKLSKTSAGI